LTDRPGWIRLKGQKRLEAARLAAEPNQLLQKFPAPDFSATARVQFTPGDSTSAGGLIISGISGLLINKDDHGMQLQRITGVSTARSGASGGGNEQREDHVDATLIDIAGFEQGNIWLRVEVKSPDANCTFSFSTDGKQFTPVGPVYRATNAGWMGAKVGLICVGEGAQLDCDSFIVE
jgi:hypothetical protein